MALFIDGMGCPICGQPMTGDQDIIGFTAVGSGDPLVQRLDDSVCHRDCLGRWKRRDEFVRAWNREAMYGLGPSWFLEVTRSGEVQYLTLAGQLLYRWGWKRSPLLPKLIQRGRPLLKLEAAYRHSPLWVHTHYGYLHSSPQPETIGLAPDLAMAVRGWAEGYDRLCDATAVEDGPREEDWRRFRFEGRRLWELLKQQLGQRYRVVYLEVGAIFEPEDSAEQVAAADRPRE